MRYLLISDLHANLDALDAVLEAARGEYDRIVCCGDLVGYGPDPNAIVDWARAHLDSVIRGNHDRACSGLVDLEWFNPVAQAATRWTIAELTPPNLAWLRELPQGPLAIEGFQLAHGSPLDEDEYVATLSDAANVFGYLDAPVTFFGHTHLQGGFRWAAGKQVAIARPGEDEELSYFRIDREGIYMVNPGSVGQPRDGDARAGFALYDTDADAVLLCRVPYDSERVRQKIEQAGLPPALGTRLLSGR